VRRIRCLLVVAHDPWPGLDPQIDSMCWSVDDGHCLVSICRLRQRKPGSTVWGDRPFCNRQKDRENRRPIEFSRIVSEKSRFHQLRSQRLAQPIFQALNKFLCSGTGVYGDQENHCHAEDRQNDGQCLEKTKPEMPKLHSGNRSGRHHEALNPHVYAMSHLESLLAKGL